MTNTMMKMSNRVKKLQQLKQIFVEMKKEMEEIKNNGHVAPDKDVGDKVTAVLSQCGETAEEEERLEEENADKCIDGSIVAVAVQLEDGNNEATLENDGVEKVDDNSLVRTVSGEDSSSSLVSASLDVIAKIWMDENTEEVCPRGSHQKSVARIKTAIGDVTPLKIGYWTGEMKTFLRWVFDSGGGDLNQRHWVQILRWVFDGGGGVQRQ